MASTVTWLRQRRRPKWAVKLVADGLLKRVIGEIALQYGQEPEAIGQTGLFAKVEPHKGEVRVLIFSLGGGFGKMLTVPVRLYKTPGDAIGDLMHGFYFYPGMIFELDGQNFFRLEYPSE